MSNPIASIVAKLLYKPITKLTPSIIQPTKDFVRRKNLLAETSGITGKLFNTKINKQSLLKANNTSKGYIRFPDQKTDIDGGKSLKELFLKDTPEGSVSIPLRSKNPDIDLVAKEMLDSKNDMKNFIQSKFYRKLLRKNGINEKEAIQGSEDALDRVNNYIVDMPNDDSLADAFYGRVRLNRASSMDPGTYLHELTHESAQLGTPKNLFADNSHRQGTLQQKILKANEDLFHKADVVGKFIKAKPNMSLEYAEYLLKPRELQANLRPIQMLMVERGWQPNQTYRLLESRGLTNKLGGDTTFLVRTLGEKGLAEVLANMLKKGGKI